MPQIRIERGAAQPTLPRSQVAFGQVFSVVNNGRTAGKQYAHLGSNGKMYSVNLATKELASSKNGRSTVKLIGKFVVKTTVGGEKRKTTRGEVLDGELFTKVTEPGALYLHMGRKASGDYISLNLVTQDIASTDNGRGDVVVVGSGALVAEIV